MNSNILRKSWTIINDVIGRSNKNCNVSNEMITNNKSSDKQFIANVFSTHYNTIGCKLANEIHSRTDPMHYMSVILVTMISLYLLSHPKKFNT